MTKVDLTKEADLCPEALLLLHCARTSLDDESKDRLEHLCRTVKIDWDLFLRSAETHGLTPLAYWHLKSLCHRGVSFERLQELAELFMSNAGRSLAHADELVKILELFKDHGIEAIPFKGPALAQHCYGDVTLRPTGDLDILVAKESVKSAMQLLREDGYRPCLWRDKVLSDRVFDSARFMDLCFEYTFSKRRAGIFVDLHWQIMSEAYVKLSAPELTQHTVQRKFFAKTVTVFDDELSLMLLCAHACNHGFYRINWIVDVAQTIDRLQIDWPRYLEWTRTTGTHRMVLLGAYLTQFLPNKNAIPALQEQIDADPEVRRWGDEIIARFLHDPTVSQWKELKGWVFRLSMKERLREKLNLLTGFTFRPTIDEYINLPLSNSLFRLYCVIRPLGLCASHLPRIAARFLTGGYDCNLNPKPRRNPGPRRF